MVERVTNKIGRNSGDWYVASDNTGTLFYLTPDQLASDIPNRAWSGSAVEARNLCIAQNRDKTWGRLHWHLAPIATLGER